jgi:hypothetical protein
MRSEEAVNMAGARIYFRVHVTLCGAPEEDTRAPEYAGHQDHRQPRPAGTCPRCWRVYREECEAMEDVTEEV